ncbi:hypothetical protein DYB37_008226 [Aphanomyces astaci]|uniref:Uncharacterized protein n=1 Tax=Aphanomyces astaci TaxID=112090 RepID=A0A3R7A195_APHAT|nr:hypothetical protein DYB35_007834 [Aphanomyces astaci]RHZ22580.1 hypothetical protein DYB37_008226 [Aphanomyces astaci]
MSGCSHDETEKTQLLDELVAIVDDQRAIKEERQMASSAVKEKALTATALIRDVAMQRASKRKSVDGDDDVTTSNKEMALIVVQQAEIDLEKQRLEYKKLKLQAGVNEQALARKERAEMREIELKRHTDLCRNLRLRATYQHKHNIGGAVESRAMLGGVLISWRQN